MVIISASERQMNVDGDGGVHHVDRAVQCLSVCIFGNYEVTKVAKKKIAFYKKRMFLVNLGLSATC